MSLLNLFGFETLSPAPWDNFWYEPTGARTPAGVVVNEDTAMTYSACWAATMLLSSAEAMIDFNLYRYLPGGGKEIAEDHPVHRLICHRPNPDMTAVMFRSSRTNHQINRGNGFAEIERDRAGRPVNLWPIHASRIPPRNRVRLNGVWTYLVNNDDGSKTPIPAADMLHVPSLVSNDGIWGMGIITQARLTIGTGIATETHAASYFGHGGSPKLIIKGIKTKNKEEKEDFRRQWNEVHGGPENNGKPAILPEGADITALNFSAEDSQFLESRTFTIQDIARWYGVPPHMIQELTRSTYSNIEHQGLEFTTYSQERWNVAWEQEVNRKLLTEEEQREMYCEHDMSSLRLGDNQTRTEANKNRFFNGEINLDEWRQADGYNPLPNGLGKIHFLQQAMVPLSVAVNGPQQAPATDATPATSANEELSLRMNAYGIGVRAGAITPQTDDEEQFRKDAGLPPMSEDTKAAWVDDDGIRRPITLRDPNAPASPFGQPAAQPTDGSKDSGGDNGDLSAKSVAEQLTTAQVSIDGKLSEFAARIETLSAEKEQLQSLVTTSQQQTAAALAVGKQLANAHLKDVWSRTLSVEINAVKRVAEKATKFGSRLQEFYGKHTTTLERNLLEPVTVCLSVSGDTRQASEVVKVLASTHAAESMKQLDALLDCQAEELPAKVEECVSKWHEERATVTI